MIHLDTSVLIDVFSGEKLLAPRLRQFLEGGERISFNVLVPFEWLRGRAFPNRSALRRRCFHLSTRFGSAEALRAAAI
jgi:predicted nucleic acid-binding protein